jgi:hypothetical protein
VAPFPRGRARAWNASPPSPPPPHPPPHPKQGAYSCICLVKGVGLVAFRDPHGIRPLVLGRRASPHGDEWAVASEDCAFGPIAFERVRDVKVCVGGCSL